MKTGKTLRTLTFLMIFLVSAVSNICNFKASGAGSLSETVGPIIYISPSAPEVAVGQNFTVEVKISSLIHGYAPDPDGSGTLVLCGDLYGFDLQLTWDPTVIKCVSHEKRVPVETYSDGVLHEPIIPVMDQVNEAGNIPWAEPGTRYWLAQASTLPAGLFNGNGTFVKMTFNVLRAGQSPININFLQMGNNNGVPIAQGSAGTWLNPPRNATYSTPGAPTANFTYWPGIGVANKAMTFNATSSQSVNTIVQYAWNFSDGTVMNSTNPVIEHVFAASRNNGYDVTLRVTDNFGVTSSILKQTVNVATTRDLTAKSMTLPDNIGPNMTLTVEPRTENHGTTNWVLYENATTQVYYNITAFDLGNLASATWVEMGSDTSLINHGGYKRNTFTMNASQFPMLEASYYFLMNVTGIPIGYEYNVTDNALLSTSMLYTALPVHKPTIYSFNYGFLLGAAYKNPVIKGEVTTINVTVLNNGNEVDTANVTILRDDSVLTYILIVDIPAKQQSSGVWTGVLIPGIYNLTAKTQAGSYSSVVRGKPLRVVEPPQLDVKYTPTNPAVNENVNFNASASTHLDPQGQFTAMSWRFYGPGYDENARGREAFRVLGNVSVVTYAFNTSGTWTVVVDVTDGNNLGYSFGREATSAYRLVTKVVVAGGFSLDPMIIGAAVLAVVLVVVVVLILLRRRRAPVVQTPIE